MELYEFLFDLKFCICSKKSKMKAIIIDNIEKNINISNLDNKKSINMFYLLIIL